MTAEAIASGVVAGILVLALDRLVPRLRSMAWSWTTNLVAKAWRRVLTAAVAPLLTDLKRDVGEMKQTMKRLDSVLAALQLRVHEQLRDRGAHGAHPPDHSPDPSPQSDEEEMPDTREQEEADDGAP